MGEDNSATASQRDEKGRFKPVKSAEGKEKDSSKKNKTSEEQVKLDDTAIGLMRADFLAGKTVEETARAFEITERRVRRWFHSFDEQERIAKSIEKSAEEQEKLNEVPPPVKPPANPPPAPDKEKNTGAEIMADYIRGMSVADMAKKHGKEPGIDSIQTSRGDSHVVCRYRDPAKLKAFLRRRRIMEITEKEPKISAKELTKRLNVGLRTIRRDRKALKAWASRTRAEPKEALNPLPFACPSCGKRFKTSQEL